MEPFFKLFENLDLSLNIQKKLYNIQIYKNSASLLIIINPKKK